ncbi:hypothetical protein AVEN_217786-1, partial [Araneus ventricosus]
EGYLKFVDEKRPTLYAGFRFHRGWCDNGVVWLSAPSAILLEKFVYGLLVRLYIEDCSTPLKLDSSQPKLTVNANNR